jgi:PAS domain S-box-containing protein
MVIQDGGHPAPSPNLMPGTSARASRRFLIAGLALCAVWVTLPSSSDIRAVLWPAIDLAAVAATAVAIARRPGMRRLPWRLFLVGELLYTIADVLFLTRPVLFDASPSFPSWGDALYLLAYAFLISAVAALLRTRSRDVDRANLVDTAIISIGLAMIVWVLLMAPYVRDAALSTSARTVSLAYPAMDILLLAGAVRLWVGLGTRGPAYWLLVGSVVAQLVSDAIYGVMILEGTFRLSSPVLGGYAVAWILFGAAALHPSAERLGEATPRTEGGSPIPRFAALTGAAMIAPVILLVQSLVGAPSDAGVLSAGAIVVFLLVFVRIRWLMVSVERHKEVATRLGNAEARYRELLDNIPAVTYVDVFEDGMDGEATALHVGPQIEELFGFPHAEWLASGGELWERLVHPDDLPGVRALATEAAARGGMRAEYRMWTKDGRLRWIREEAAVDTDPDSGHQTWRGVMYDVTERHDVEDALRLAETSYRLLVEQLPFAVYSQIVEGDASFNYVSPKIETLLGYPQQQWLEEHGFWDSLIHPDDVERTVAMDQLANATGERYADEYRMRHEDGRYLWIRDEAILIEGAPGKREVWHGLLADVTDRRATQQELEASFAEVRRLSAERSHLLDRLVDAQELERERIAGDIHDDPLQKLTAVGLRLNALRPHLGSDEGLAAMRVLESTVSTAIMRLRRLLFDLHPRTLDTGGLAEALHEFFDGLAGEGDEVDYLLDNRLATEPTSRIRVIAYRVAQEALQNVRKHAGATHVEVTLEPRDDGLFVSIVDDGVGADPEVLASSPRGHMGITSMRERVTIAGGWFRITSSPGAGARVEFWLPDTLLWGSTDRLSDEVGSLR